uniref:Uncharacterized protein n=1 Tax=Meloidogyne enterolobii TaxID=390850 RepID=A0A6V7Y0J0_MELEN|nr:unnamed protein product [Meloidogyne enterolobii]
MKKGAGPSNLQGKSQKIQRPPQPDKLGSLIQQLDNSIKQHLPNAGYLSNYQSPFQQYNPLLNLNQITLPPTLYALQQQKLLQQQQRQQQQQIQHQQLQRQQHLQQQQQRPIGNIQIIGHQPINAQVHSLNTAESSSIRPRIDRNPTIPMTSALNTAILNPPPQLPFNQQFQYSIYNPVLAENKRHFLNTLVSGVNIPPPTIQQRPQQPPLRPIFSEHVRGQLQAQQYRPNQPQPNQFQIGQFQPQQSSHGSNNTPRDGANENSSNTGDGNNA